MAISKMKKLSLAAMRSDLPLLMERLTWAGCVEISDQGEAFAEDADFSPNRQREALREAEAAREELLAALEELKPYAPPPKGFFGKKESSPQRLFDDADPALAEAGVLAGKVAFHADALQRTTASSWKDRTDADGLLPWCSLELDGDVTATERVDLLFGSLPLSVSVARLEEILGKFPQADEASDGAGAEEILAYKAAADPAGAGDAPLAAAYEITTSDLARRYFVFYVLREEREALLRRLSPLGFVRQDPLPEGFTFGEDTPHTFEAARKQLLAEAAEKAKKAEEHRQALMALALQKNRLEQAADLLEMRLTRLRAAEGLAVGAHSLLLTGWVPEKDMARLEKALAPFDCTLVFSDPEEEENVPVQLNNKKIFHPFESVVEMYSLPMYGSFDPTPIMSAFYFVIFGLMLGDVVYGLLLTTLCFWAIRRLSLSPGMKQLVTLFGYCGVACMVSGLVFSGYLGNLPGQIVTAATGKPFAMPGIDLLSQEGIFIFIFVSLAVGALQIFTAMGIKMYMLCKKGQVFAAVFDVGSWFVIFAGLALTVLVKGVAGPAVMIVGVVMRVSTAGRAKKGIFGKITGGLLGLYDIVNYLSDLVSYMRIMALGLASVVIAYVVNILATLLISPGFSVSTLFGWILMPVILLLGHTINIVLNLLGCFVHDGRLQYIEFFGRFYEDGGRPFAPLKPVATFTDIDYESGEAEA